MFAPVTCRHTDDAVGKTAGVGGIGGEHRRDTVGGRGQHLRATRVVVARSAREQRDRGDAEYEREHDQGGDCVLEQPGA